MEEQNLHTGDQKERKDFINLDENDANEFNKEWKTKTKCVSEIPRITSQPTRTGHVYGGYPR
ncbi:hypothetical protein ABEB36_002951 [Hypothenemus hampei]|uniref:Uncharacterized protein n=1 Tax=Hypothenemus hampei TaxID=57062 RepID=A0ABD1F7L0_HYPHA